MPKTKVKTPVAQWYVVQTISGSERSFMHDIKDKINAYNLSSELQDVQVIMEDIKEETEITRENAPKKLTPSKTPNSRTEWQVLPNGNYKKIVTKTKNRYAGYVFVKMVMNDTIFLIIRSTPGVTGFLGSSGKGVKPSPMASDEILGVLGFSLGDLVRITGESGKGTEGILVLDAKTNEPMIQLPNGKRIPVNFYEIEKVVPVAPVAPVAVPGAPVKAEKPKAHFEVGNTVRLNAGSFEGETGTVASINVDNGTAVVMVDMFGRETPVTAAFANIVVDK